MRNRPSAPRRTAALLGAVALSLTLVACGGSEDGPDGHASEVHTASNGDVYNSADVEFATGMIPHHAQAIQMTILTRGRPLDREVARLVEQIREAQTPEVETMSDWLSAWGEDIPETSLDHANAGHDSDGMGEGHGDQPEGDMPGMMSHEEMSELQAASDQDFQDLWLQMMIEHHEGAIEMAETEQEEGAFADAIALAESIESSQAAEIETMERLLG